MQEILHRLFITPWEYEFMARALGTIVLICFTCGLLSTFMILKGLSLFGDALSHAVLPGIVLALLLSVHISIGVFIAALLVTLSIRYLERNTKLKQQTILSFTTSSFMGIGFLLYYAFPPGVRISEILFGKVVGTTWQDIAWLGFISVACLAAFALLYRTWALVFFDRLTALTLGLRVSLYELVFYLLIAVAVMSSLRTVGSLLVVSLLIVPGALGYILSDRLLPIMVISTLFSVVTGVLGLLFSFAFDVTTGASIITLQFLTFLVVFFSKYAVGRLSRSQLTEKQQQEKQQQEQQKQKQQKQENQKQTKQEESIPTIPQTKQAKQELSLPAGQVRGGNHAQ